MKINYSPAKLIALFFISSGFLFVTTGCDHVYRLLQKESAEEKELLGEVLSFEPNPRVEELQKLLKLYGYNPGTIDGKFGQTTRRAVEKFQKDNGLKPSRFVDRSTWERLNIFSSSGLVDKGEVNIAKVQTALQNAGFDPGKADGRMGKKTLEALKKFQKANALLPDGKTGFETLNKLVSYLKETDDKNKM